MRFALSILTFAIALAPVTASAQSWLYVTLTPFRFGNSTLLEVPLTSAGLGSPQRQIGLPGRAGQAVVTADGRFVVSPVWFDLATVPVLTVFDRRSGQLTTLPGAMLGHTLLSDPTAPRVFVCTRNSITVIDTAGIRTLPIAEVDGLVTPALSSDGRELFVARYRTVDPGGTRVYHIAVLDPLTGAERRVLPELSQGMPTSMALSHDRQRLFVTLGNPVALRVLDPVSGTELLSRGPLANPSVGPEIVGNVHVDDRNGRLFVGVTVTSGSAFVSSLYVLDASTLDIVSAGPGGIPNLAVDRSLGMVVNVGSSRNIIDYCVGMNVSIWSAPSAPLVTLPVPSGGLCPSITIATPPDAPTNLTHSIDGRQVTFNWSSVPGATGYVIEAGSRSGEADLARIQTDQPTFSVGSVPLGTYFLRVRAFNEVGPSAVSNEVIVNVQ